MSESTLSGQEMGKFARDGVGESLERILDFVERWNKNDAEKQIADDAENVREWLKFVREF